MYSIIIRCKSPEITIVCILIRLNGVVLKSFSGVPISLTKLFAVVSEVNVLVYSSRRSFSVIDSRELAGYTI